VVVAAAVRAHCPAVVEPETAHPPVASRTQEEAPGAAVGKAPVLEPHFALELDRAKADPTLVMSAVIVPSARRRDTLGEAGRDSSNNLCVMTLRYHAADEKRNSGTRLTPITLVARLAISLPP
jgi:hypothetical protein